MTTVERERRPDRVRGPGHDEFWTHCDAGELHMQRCGSCAHLNWPPVPTHCERCGSRDLAWERLSGRGRIISWCTFERAYYPDVPLPWDAILVELDEGPLFLSNPHGFTADDITPNMPVTVTFLDCEDSGGPFRLPVFAPA